MDILIYNAGIKVATTSKAFDILVKNELMRSRTLDFAIVNTDNARQFIIPNAVFEAEGQDYNLTDFVSESGGNNITSVSAEHVSYELNDYVVPAGYAFVGTVAAILQDMLTQSGADAKFTAGTCAGVSGSLALNNTQDMNSRAAILRLVDLGVEVDFDNYTINLPVQVGADNGKIFQFGRDLVDFKRTYNKSAGTMTYEIGIATLMRIPGALSSDTFAVGDTVIIADSILGDQIEQRIVCYDKHLDDPTQDAVTIGAFIPDSSDTTAAMQIDISNSVQQETAYSNVSIDHVNGFMAINAAGTIGVKMNATNCFAVYSIAGGVWTLLSELDADGLHAGKLSNPADSTSYGEIGSTASGEGLVLWDTSVSAAYPYLALLKYSDNSGFCLVDKNGVQRLAVVNAGDVSLNDDATNPIFLSQKAGNFTQLHIPSATNNAIGVDATGAYKITAGTKVYL